jgi:hypothetical protein
MHVPVKEPATQALVPKEVSKNTERSRDTRCSEYASRVHTSRVVRIQLQLVQVTSTSTVHEFNILYLVEIEGQ